jgi:hypothetical protein
LDKRDQANLNLTAGNTKESDLTRSGNNNAVEVYIARSGDNIINITISLEADTSSLENSNNLNMVKIYIGEAEEVNMGDSTVVVVGGKKTNETAPAGQSQSKSI